MRYLRAELTSRFTVFHGSELSLIFGPVPNPVEDDFANQLTDFYINFVNDMNPGGEQKPGIFGARLTCLYDSCVASIRALYEECPTADERQYHSDTRWCVHSSPVG